MARDLEIFFSNHLEILYQQLKGALFGSKTTPLMRRLVVVYGPAMKTWLMLRMAQDPELNIAMGIEFIYLHQAFEHLLSWRLLSKKN
jgi:exodeoxyribonuclease V gamma subunit